ncbi:MAG: 50S ribosomal protein L28 [Myxococcota bacterium]|nr:50S ribosomal protein L28 [Myxococcota bacterium]
MPKCELTSKGPIVKNLVSHSNIKTKKWSQPNLQKRRIFSEALGRHVTLRVTNSAIRSIDHVGGFDRFILKQPEKQLSRRARSIRQQVRRALS